MAAGDHVVLDLGEEAAFAVELIAHAGEESADARGVLEVAGGEVLGFDARVRLIEVTPPDREHGVDDVVVDLRDVMGEGMEQGFISADAGAGGSFEADLEGRLDIASEALGEKMDLVSARDEVGRQVDGIAFGSAALGLGVLDDEGDFQD